MATYTQVNNVEANIGILGANMVKANIIGRRLYWYGGTGSWSDYTNHWSLNSGNSPASPASSAPTSGDDVYFDANSGTTTCTIDVAAYCANFTASASTITTFAENAGQYLYIYGSFTLKSGLSWFSGSSKRTYFKATDTGKKITTNGVTVNGSVYFDGVGGGWTFQDNFACANGSTTFDNGSLDTNSKNWNIGWGLGSNGTAIRNLSLGSSNINGDGSGTTWTLFPTNLTFDAGTSTITLGTSSSGFSGGTGLTYYNLVVNLGSFVTNFSFSSGNTFNNITLNGGSGKDTVIDFSANQTVNGTLTITGNSALNRLFVKSSSLGVTRTLTCAAVSLSNLDFRDITGAGAATWSGTSIGNALGNSGITFTTPVTRYWMATSGGSWSNTSSWSADHNGATGASVPICHDTAIIDDASITSSSRAISVDVPRPCCDLVVSGVLNSPTIDNTTVSMLTGSFTLSSGLGGTPFSSNAVFLMGRSNHTITFGGKTVGNVFMIQSHGGTYTLQDDAQGTSHFGVDRGTFNAVTHNLTFSALLSISNNPGTKVINMGSGIWTATGTGAVWGNSFNSTTLNCDSSTIVISNTTATSKTFGSDARTLNNVEFTGDNITVPYSNTFNQLKLNNPGLPNGTKFTAGRTQTVSSFVATGTAGNLIVIQSSAAGSASTLLKSSGRVVCDYLSIKDSATSGNTAWYAGNNSVRLSGVTGWLFEDPWDNNVKSSIAGFVSNSVKSSINNSTTQDSSVKADIKSTITVSFNSKSNVSVTSSYAVKGKSNILRTYSDTGFQSAKADILSRNITVDQSTKVDIKTVALTQNNVKSNILTTYSQNNNLKLDIKRTESKENNSTSSIVVTNTYGNNTKVSILVTEQKANNVKTSIVRTVTSSSSVLSSIVIRLTYDNSSKASLYLKNVQNDNRAKSDIFSTLSNNNSSKSWIIIYQNFGVNIKADIYRTYLKDDGVIADIKAVGQRAVYSKANIFRGNESIVNNTKSSLVVTHSGSWSAKLSIVRTESYSQSSKTDIRHTYTNGNSGVADISSILSFFSRVKTDIVRVGEISSMQVKVDIKTLNNKTTQYVTASIVTTNIKHSSSKVDILRIGETKNQNVKVDIKHTYSSGQSVMMSVIGHQSSRTNVKASIVVTNRKDNSSKVDVKQTYTNSANGKADILHTSLERQSSKADLLNFYTYSNKTKFDIVDTFTWSSYSLAVIHHPSFAHSSVMANVSPKTANYVRASIQGGTYDIYVPKTPNTRKYGQIYKDFL